jgi:hypothetical protein
MPKQERHEIIEERLRKKLKDFRARVTTHRMLLEGEEEHSAEWHYLAGVISSWRTAVIEIEEVLRR